MAKAVKKAGTNKSAKTIAKNVAKKAVKNPVKKAGNESSVTAQVDGFIEKFDPSMAKMIRSCRAVMRKRLPTATELIYDNYNFFVIAYGPNERPSNAIASLACSKNGISLAFLYAKTLPDPQRLLQGDGTQTGFVRLKSAGTLSEPAVDALLQAAVEQAKAPFATSGKLRTIVRGISAKQRPRR
ncbi:MAG TPA: DUF1801 domain-containing protein [Gemmatimonadaceae bacterium]|jgi:hypothetical protein